jgi:glycosyltransferase involved in cell wall biosynthesis
VLEAMAMAKPVVVTRAAMEGIEAGPAVQVSVFDEPEQFAEQVSYHLQQPIKQVIENRQYVQADFSWQQNGEKLCRLIAGHGD